MNCNQVRVRISELLDDDQEVGKVKEIHDHLESCHSCTGFYEEKLKVAQWLKEAENLQLEPPSAIWQRIDSKITTTKFKRPKKK